MSYIYNGKTFESKAEIARENNIKVETLYARIGRGLSLDEAVKLEITSSPIEVKYNNKKYSSISEASRDLGLRPEYIYNRTRKGLSIQDAIDEVMKLRGK